MRIVKTNIPNNISLRPVLQFWVDADPTPRQCLLLFRDQSKADDPTANQTQDEPGSRTGKPHDERRVGAGAASNTLLRRRPGVQNERRNPAVALNIILGVTVPDLAWERTPPASHMSAPRTPRTPGNESVANTCTAHPSPSSKPPNYSSRNRRIHHFQVSIKRVRRRKALLFSSLRSLTPPHVKSKDENLSGLLSHVNGQKKIL